MAGSCFFLRQEGRPHQRAPPMPERSETPMTDRETLRTLLCAASRQSKPFQSLICDYAAEVMAEPETHRLFSERLAADLPMQREITILMASLSAEVCPLSPMMQDVLAAAEGLQSGSHTNLREIADVVAVELVYKLRETV